MSGVREGTASGFNLFLSCCRRVHVCAAPCSLFGGVKCGFLFAAGKAFVQRVVCCWQSIFPASRLLLAEAYAQLRLCCVCLYPLFSESAVITCTLTFCWTICTAAWKMLASFFFFFLFFLVLLWVREYGSMSSHGMAKSAVHGHGVEHVVSFVVKTS